MKMMTRLQGPVLGGISVAFLVMNTIFWTTPLFAVAFLKLITPGRKARETYNTVLNNIALSWIACNNFGLRHTRTIKWDVEGTDGLDPNGWYLVLCNHQSWADIPVLQKVFHRRIPFLKFFLKKELIWVPILGLAWWALEFPFMKRYSKAFLKKNPHLRGKDMEITKRACEKFKNTPVSIMNFVEGTRFTPEKHQAQLSPYANLLRPKAGGTGFVLSAMGSQISHILNVTIVYPDCEDKGFWAFLCGRVTHVVVRIETIPVTDNLLGNYMEDDEFRERFQRWISDLWTQKDLCIEKILTRADAGHPFVSK